jgi:hypothetical protein
MFSRFRVPPERIADAGDESSALPLCPAYLGSFTFRSCGSLMKLHRADGDRRLVATEAGVVNAIVVVGAGRLLN